MEENERQQMPLEKTLWQTGIAQRIDKILEEIREKRRIEAKGAFECSQEGREEHERRCLSRWNQS